MATLKTGQLLFCSPGLLVLARATFAISFSTSHLLPSATALHWLRAQSEPSQQQLQLLKPTAGSFIRSKREKKISSWHKA